MTLQELYAAPDSWTQDTLSRDRNGVSVVPDDPEAASWCLLGAVLKCYEDGSPGYERATSVLRERLGCMIDWNNQPGRTIEQVRDLVAEVGV